MKKLKIFESETNDDYKDYICDVRLSWTPKEPTIGSLPDSGELRTKITGHGNDEATAKQSVLDYYKKYNPNVKVEILSVTKV